MDLTDQDSFSLSKSNSLLEKAEISLRYRGRLQGAGFQPTVWRLAKELDLTGSFNDLQDSHRDLGNSSSDT